MAEVVSQLALSAAGQAARSVPGAVEGYLRARGTPPPPRAPGVLLTRCSALATLDLESSAVAGELEIASSYLAAAGERAHRTFPVHGAHARPRIELLVVKQRDHCDVERTGFHPKRNGIVDPRTRRTPLLLR